MLLPGSVWGSPELHEEQPEQQILVSLFPECTHSHVSTHSDMIKNFAGGDPLQPRVSRIRGSVPIAPHTKPVTPKCASPPTNLKLTSSRKRRNEIRCAPSFRVPPSASDATMPKLPSSFSTKKKTCSCNDVSVQQFVLQVLLCVCQPGARLEKRWFLKVDAS